MKKISLSILWIILCILPFTACAKDDNFAGSENMKGNGNGEKTLVVYFSCTNSTKGIADHITNILDAAEFRIVPEVSYTSADLNYNDNNCRANKEQSDDSARPAISNVIENISDYDVIYVGFPIWWGKMPKIMFTFFDAYDLSGKTIIPFCTSGSSGISTAMNEIRSLEPDATILNGNRFPSGANENTVREWVNSVQPTGVASVKMEEGKARLGYNLQGQAVDPNSASGIVIVNGKKYLKRNL